MSFTTFKTFPQDLRALKNDLRYLVAVRDANTRHCQTDNATSRCDITRYSETSMLANNFVVDIDSNANFVFISPNASSAKEEQAFTIRGTLAELALPPIMPLHGSERCSITTISQYIKLTSFPTDSSFNRSSRAVGNIVDMLIRAVPYDTSFLSPADCVHALDVVDVPRYIDPTGLLSEALLSSEGLVMSRRNIVRYWMLKKNNDDNVWTRVRHTNASIFRPGSLVEADVSFRLLKVAPGTYSVAYHISDLVMVSDKCHKFLNEIRMKNKFRGPSPFPISKRLKENVGGWDAGDVHITWTGEIAHAASYEAMSTDPMEGRNAGDVVDEEVEGDSLRSESAK
ncbi:hypothetical protein BDZ89DRAFT_1140933 [Hymenopellis radicata]|nr:hypothetical protein BDZ89DRAFT_1140933 [Hymenopellis radicata]